MNKNNTILWNEKLRISFSDVDETIAEVYTPAESEMIKELSSFLYEGRKLFLVTGGSLKRVTKDITDFIDPLLRHDILISHCSGAEVWGFTSSGTLRTEPFYSKYEENFTSEMKKIWREVIAQLIQEFSLRTFPPQPKIAFRELVSQNPLDIMLDDRGPQITMEVVNGVDITKEQVNQLPFTVAEVNGKYDLRSVIQKRAIELLQESRIPITPHFGGNFALDFAVEGVSKTTSIKSVISMPDVLATIGLVPKDIQNPDELEIWGDKFSISNGGTDRYMCEALSPSVRAIDFREENSKDLPTQFNIAIWNGKQHLHHGLLEYLQSRK